MTKKIKKPWYKKWWVWVLTIVILGAIGSTIDEEEPAETASTNVVEEKVKKEEEEKKKAEEKKELEEKAAKEKQEQEEKENLVSAFKVASKQLVEDSNGIISDVTIDEYSNYFQVNVYVDESTWARSNESEKLSFATTVGTAIENALSPHNTYVDIRSSLNHDVVASQKMFGGWKIKR